MQHDSSRVDDYLLLDSWIASYDASLNNHGNGRSHNSNTSNSNNSSNNNGNNSSIGEANSSSTSTNSGSSDNLFWDNGDRDTISGGGSVDSEGAAGANIDQYIYDALGRDDDDGYGSAYVLGSDGSQAGSNSGGFDFGGNIHHRDQHQHQYQHHQHHHQHHHQDRGEDHIQQRGGEGSKPFASAAPPGTASFAAVRVNHGVGAAVGARGDWDGGWSGEASDRFALALRHLLHDGQNAMDSHLNVSVPHPSSQNAAAMSLSPPLALQPPIAAAWPVTEIQRVIDSPINPVGKFLRDSRISAQLAARTNIMPFLIQAPRKPREKYGKRRQLNAEQRESLNRQRNRNHARATRQRRRIFRAILSIRQRLEADVAGAADGAGPAASGSSAVSWGDQQMTHTGAAAGG